MTRLTRLQIDLIRGDIRQSGVELRDLEDDLLDHICCTIESETSKEQPFEKVYDSVKKKICPDGYREVQETTAKLITQKYNTMKKTMNTLGIVGSSVLLIGSILKHLRLAPANEALFLGGLIIILGYLPLLLILSLRQTDLLLGKIRNISGYLGANFIVAGVVFQVLHYPYGMQLLVLGMVVFLLLFVPLFFRSVGRESLANIHPVTVTVIVLAIVSSFFAFSIRRPSNAYINGLLAVNQNIEKSYEHKLSRIGEGELSEEANNALTYIENLKQQLAKTIDPKRAELNQNNILVHNKVLNNIMLTDIQDYNGVGLKNVLSDYIKKIKQSNLHVETILDTKDEKWLESNFENRSLYNIYTQLSSYQLEIVTLEMEL